MNQLTENRDNDPLTQRRWLNSDLTILRILFAKREAEQIALLDEQIAILVLT
jgi:hypothetical protein